MAANDSLYMASQTTEVPSLDTLIPQIQKIINFCDNSETTNITIDRIDEQINKFSNSVTLSKPNKHVEHALLLLQQSPNITAAFIDLTGSDKSNNFSSS